MPDESIFLKTAHIIFPCGKHSVLFSVTQTPAVSKKLFPLFLRYTAGRRNYFYGLRFQFQPLIGGKIQGKLAKHFPNLYSSCPGEAGKCLGG